MKNKKNTAADLATENESYLKDLLLRKPVEENRELADKVAELSVALEEYESYKNYGERLASADAKLLKAKKAYDKRQTSKRLDKYLAAELERGTLVGKHNKTDIEAIEVKLKNFESLIDKRYWDEVTLFFIEMEIRYGLSNSIGQAVKNIEARKSRV